MIAGAAKKHDDSDSEWGRDWTAFLDQLNLFGTQAQYKKSRSYGKTDHKDENVVDGGNCIASRRSLIQHGYTHSPEECPATAFAWKNIDGRWKLLMYLPVKKPGQISHLGSQNHVDADGSLSLSPPVIFVRFDLQLDQMVHPIDIGSGNSFSHLKDESFKKSQPRNRRSRPLKSSPNDWLHNCFLPNNSPSLECDDSSLIVTDVLDADIPKIEKPTKKYLRKKGKKKGKRFKRSSHKKESAETKRTLCETPSIETHAYFDQSCSGECIPESKSSNSATASSVSLKTSKVKSDRGSCENCLNSLETPIEHTSCNENMVVSESTCSLSEEFSYEISNCDQASSVGNSLIDMQPTSIEHIDNSASSQCCVDQENVAMLHSFLGGWNSNVGASDGGCNNDETKTDSNENHKINLLDSQAPFCPSSAGTMSCSSVLSSYDEEFEKDKEQINCINISKHQDWLDGFADNTSRPIQTCSNALQSFMLYNNGNNGRKRSVSSNDVYKHHDINAHCIAGKDSDHSFWQRVQKKNAQACISRPKILISSPASGCPEDPKISIKKNPSLTSRTHKSNDEKYMHSGPAKLKVKSSSSLKEDTTYCSKKDPHSSKSNGARPLNALDQHAKVFRKPLMVDYHEPPAFSGEFSCKDDRNNEVPHCSAVEQHQSEIEIGKGTVSNGRQSYPIYANSSQNIENQFNPLVETLNSEQQICPEVQSIRNDHLCKDGHHTEGEFTDKSKKNHHSSSLTKKWVPVRRKDMVASNISQTDDFFYEKDITDIENNHKNHSGNENLAASVTSTIYGGSNSNFCQEKKGLCISRVNADLDKIVKAVNDAYRLQFISESYHRLTGNPIAQFERVLHSASPVLCQVDNIARCKSCSGNQLVGNLICQHKIPDMPLGSLWHWYEKPGNYGLEVKVEDHLMKKLGNARFEFCAYFVPYLSALQIFRQSNVLMCSSKEGLEGKDSHECVMSAISEQAFQLHTHPIFSMLPPMPSHKAETTSSVGRPFSSLRNENCDHSLNTRGREGELLFEYFESDPPQQRRPMFDRIKELTRGNVSSTCSVFGDPSILRYIHFKDVHPSSWFSVAWYPIYRIPDGSFRAAFLTYHSLGNFIQRNSESEPSGAVHIVSPVVGLQSYNSKGECWFQQSEHESKEAQKDASHLNPAEILKERLRTLEQTAFVMARASIHRGEQKSVNRQSDYEFFLSRR